MLFTPIMKTKKISEYNALLKIDKILDNKPEIMPYIECIKSINKKCVLKYLDALNGKYCFIEPLYDEIKPIIKNYLNYSNNYIFVFRITGSTTKEEIEYYINQTKQNNRQTAIKVNDADDRFMDLFQKLGSNDYLFIELGGTSYTASYYLDDVIDAKLKCKIIIHSNEREQYLTGNEFANFDYNNKDKFNFSIINAIKSGKFIFDGFGSRCSAKNDNTEEVRIAKEVYGVFLIFDYNENNFYTVKSLHKKHISSVYYDVKEIINKNKSRLDKDFFDKTLISKATLEDYLSSSKFSCSKLITVSIIRYIEEITRYLF